MIFIRKEDLIHKSYINRLLIEIIDNLLISGCLAFKGGTCASMLGYLDRFSVDLDFDVIKKTDETELRKELHEIFDNLGMVVVKELQKALLFQVRYPSDPGKRNTLKISAIDNKIKANEYQGQYLPEIDRFMKCQTIETMFANKLVAVLDRYNLHKTIAGRDIYDIHYFFTHGYSFNESVIKERTGLSAKGYFEKLANFILKNVTQKVINEDLNALLPPERFQMIRKILIPETISLLELSVDIKIILSDNEKRINNYE